MKNDPLETIGSVLTGTHERDAVHIAIMPVTSDAHIAPGDSVAMVPGTNKVTKTSMSLRVGVADPYLAGRTKPGEQFWLFLLPATITGLRHDWTCPAIDDLSPPTVRVSEHRAWLLDFANRRSISYNDMLEAAQQGPGARIVAGEELGDFTEDEHAETP